MFGGIFQMTQLNAYSVEPFWHKEVYKIGLIMRQQSVLNCFLIAYSISRRANFSHWSHFGVSIPPPPFDSRLTDRHTPDCTFCGDQIS